MVTTAVHSLLIPHGRASTHPQCTLVCFPFAGANPYLYLDWGNMIGPQVNVLGVHLPGRGARFQQPSLDSLSAIVSEVVDALSVLPDCPFAFYGHSLGALVAFEATRELRRLGRRQPCRLFAGGARPPHRAALLPHLHGLDRAAFIESVQGRYGGIPVAVVEEPEFMDLFIPALRADFAVYENYEHRAEDPLGLPISVFTGVDDPLITPDLALEWSRHTTAEFEMSVLPGDHFFLVPSRSRLITGIRSKLPITR